MTKEDDYYMSRLLLHNQTESVNRLRYKEGMAKMMSPGRSPVKEPPNEPPPGNPPPVEEPPNSPKGPPIKEPPPKDPDPKVPDRPPMHVKKNE
jgi:hypothetical protein